MYRHIIALIICIPNQQRGIRSTLVGYDAQVIVYPHHPMDCTIRSASLSLPDCRLPGLPNAARRPYFRLPPVFSRLPTAEMSSAKLSENDFTPSSTSWSVTAFIEMPACARSMPWIQVGDSTILPSS